MMLDNLKCVYCGNPLDDDSICECEERRRALEKDFAKTKAIDIDCNEDIGADEMTKVKEMVSDDYFELAYTMYKLGLIRGHEAEQRKHI